MASSSPMRQRTGSTASVRFLEPELAEVEESEAASSPAGSRVLRRTATDFGIKGGRSVDEVLSRNQVSFADCETFPPEEITRMYRIFRLFRQPDVPEVVKEDIHDILIHLGYFVATQEDVAQILAEVSEFSTFDFREVVEVAERCATRERTALEAVFAELANPEHSGVSTAELIEALRRLGAVPLQTVIDEVLLEAGLARQEVLQYNEFMRFIAVYRVTEGFKKEEVAQAQVTFRRFSAQGSDDNPATPMQRDIKVTQLRGALQDMFSPHCADHVRQLLEKLGLEEAREPAGGSDGEEQQQFDHHNQGICFHEFLVFCRRVKTSIVGELQEILTVESPKGTSSVPTSMLPKAMAALGFTLFPPAVREFLAAISCEPGADLSFDNFVSYVQECRARSGFMRREVEHLSSVFRKFDGNSTGTVESLELLDLLRYLGYTTSLEDVRRFLAHADPNAGSNAPMDLTEFLRRMRLFREEELQSVRHTFNAHCDPATGTLPLDRTLTALTNSGNMPRAEVLGAALKAAGELPTLTFENFMGVVDHCREQTVAEKRKRAGFCEKTYRQVCQLFNKHKKRGHDTLDKGEVLWFLIEIGVPVSTREERAEVFGLLKKARASALHAGLTPEEVGPVDESSMTIWALLHLLRHVVRSDESKNVEHEERAMDTTGFLRSELREFRSIFDTWVRRENSVRAPTQPPPPAEAGKRRGSLPAGFGDDSHKSVTAPGSGLVPSAPSKPLERHMELSDLLGADEREGRLTLEAMMMLLCSIGLRLDSRQEHLLRARAVQVAAQDGNTMDYADFLVLMRWMLDSNFADINDHAERLVDRMTRASARATAYDEAARVVASEEPARPTTRRMSV